MKITLQYNKNLFVSYLGLTVGGYTLANIKENEGLFDLIKNIEWDKDISPYFAKAKTPTCEVNPYYPRAIFLTLASLFLSGENPVYYNDFEGLSNYIKSMPINPVEKDDNAIEWIRQLPYYFEKIIENKEFNCLWNFYLSEVKMNAQDYQEILDNAASKIMKVFNVEDEYLPKIIVIPNRLQAPQASDVAYKDDAVYIIKSKPDEESIIHEYLHSILDKRLEDNKELIGRHLYLLKPVLSEMLKYQYAWDYGTDSWHRVFEESLMRAFSIWLCNLNDTAAAAAKANEYSDYGFTYVPVILENLMNKWDNIHEFNEFLKSCLEDCSKNAGNTIL